MRRVGVLEQESPHLPAIAPPDSEGRHALRQAVGVDVDHHPLAIDAVRGRRVLEAPAEIEIDVGEHRRRPDAAEEGAVRAPARPARGPRAPPPNRPSPWLKRTCQLGLAVPGKARADPVDPPVAVHVDEVAIGARLAGARRRPRRAQSVRRLVGVVPEGRRGVDRLRESRARVEPNRRRADDREARRQRVRSGAERRLLAQQRRRTEIGATGEREGSRELTLRPDAEIGFRDALGRTLGRGVLHAAHPIDEPVVVHVDQLTLLVGALIVLGRVGDQLVDGGIDERRVLEARTGIEEDLPIPVREGAHEVGSPVAIHVDDLAQGLQAPAPRRGLAQRAVGAGVRVVPDLVLIREAAVPGARALAAVDVDRRRGLGRPVDQIGKRVSVEIEGQVDVSTVDDLGDPIDVVVREVRHAPVPRTGARRITRELELSRFTVGGVPLFVAVDAEAVEEPVAVQVHQREDRPELEARAEGLRILNRLGDVVDDRRMRRRVAEAPAREIGRLDRREQELRRIEGIVVLEPVAAQLLEAPVRGRPRLDDDAPDPALELLIDAGREGPQDRPAEGGEILALEADPEGMRNARRGVSAVEDLGGERRIARLLVRELERIAVGILEARHVPGRREGAVRWARGNGRLRRRRATASDAAEGVGHAFARADGPAIRPRDRGSPRRSPRRARAGSGPRSSRTSSFDEAASVSRKASGSDPRQVGVPRLDRARQDTERQRPAESDEGEPRMARITQRQLGRRVLAPRRHEDRDRHRRSAREQMRRGLAPAAPRRDCSRRPPVPPSPAPTTPAARPTQERHRAAPRATPNPNARPASTHSRRRDRTG